MTEKILEVFPSDAADRRIAVVEMRRGDEIVLSLQQQTFSSDIGWFAQSCIELEAQQLPSMKLFFTGCNVSSRQRMNRSATRSLANSSFEPIVFAG